jgi:hypothetical protein
MALVMAIGIMTVLAISGTTITYYATSNSGSASRSKAGQSAYALAEAGINAALSVLSASFQPATPTALPDCTTNSYAGPVSVEGGSYKYCGTLPTGSTVWTIKGIGTIKNPSNVKTTVSRTITRTVSIQGLNSGSSISAWDRIYNDDTSVCFNIPDGEIIPSNVSARGDMCMIGSEITGTSTQVAVGGTLTLTNGATQSPVQPAGAGAGWTSSGSIGASDNAKASTTVAANTDAAPLDATGFGFALPASATVVGVTVKLERAASASSTLKTSAITLLKAGATTGTSKSSSTFWGTGDANATFGAASDLWGATFTPADVNASNFGVRIVPHNYTGSSAMGYMDYVEITVSYTLAPSIGLSGTPIAKADIAGTCKLNGAAAHTPCTSADSVFAGAITTTPTGLQKPTVDFNYWYNNAAPGPKHPCDTQTGTPPSFDNDSSYNNSNNNQKLLFSSASYTCLAKDAGGNVIGQLSWNSATRVLTVSGTIFFDSDTQFDPHDYMGHYQGKATIYMAGGTHIDAELCAGGSGLTGCRGPGMSNWDPTQNMLVLIMGDKNSAGSDDCKIDEDDSAFQGVIWTKNNCKIKAGADVSAPILSSKVQIDANGGVNFFPWPPLGALLPGQVYGSTSTSTDFLISPGNQSG